MVDLMGSLGVRRPFESIKCDAKIVLINVDLPSPVCPILVKASGHLCFLNILPTQMTLNWNPLFSSLRSICEVMLSKPTWLLGMTVSVWPVKTLAADILRSMIYSMSRARSIWRQRFCAALIGGSEAGDLPQRLASQNLGEKGQPLKLNVSSAASAQIDVGSRRKRAQACLP